jgi:hypothetical protein
MLLTKPLTKPLLRVSRPAALLLLVLRLQVAYMLTYADVCCRMLPYADVCCRMLTYADACSRMLTYADVC